MEIDDVLNYFGSARATCKLLGIAEQNFTVWKKNKFIPLINQIRLQEITKGQLKANMDLLNKPASRTAMQVELEELRAFKKAHEKDSEAHE